MRNKLQYFYSMAVFLGVLLTSYLSFNQESSQDRPLASWDDGYAIRSQSAQIPDSFSRLLQLEETLKKQYSIETQDPFIFSPPRYPTVPPVLVLPEKNHYE